MSILQTTMMILLLTKMILILLATMMILLLPRGNLEWTDKSRRRCHIFWKSPAQLGQEIYKYGGRASGY